MSCQFLLPLAIFLAGCVAQPVQTTDRVTTQYATLPDEWLAPCKIVEPPDQITYVTSTLEKQKDQWANAYIEQAKQAALCNVRLKEARTYNAKKAKETVVQTCVNGVCK